MGTCKPSAQLQVIIFLRCSPKLPPSSNPTSLSLMTANVCTLSNAVLFCDLPTEGKGTLPSSTCWGMWKCSPSQSTQAHGSQTNVGKSLYPSNHFNALLQIIAIKAKFLKNGTLTNISCLLSYHSTSCFLVTVMQIYSSILSYSLPSGHWYFLCSSSPD